MYPLKLHKTLTPERWSQFSTGQQLLMIGNEMNRLINGIKVNGSLIELKACMERALELTDLTVSLARPNLQKELLRWRDLLAEVYLMEEQAVRNQVDYLKKLLRALLLLNGKSAMCWV